MVQAPIVSVSGEVAGVVFALVSAGVSLWTRAAVAELRTDFLQRQQEREDKLKDEYASAGEFSQLDHRVTTLERKAIAK